MKRTPWFIQPVQYKEGDTFIGELRKTLQDSLVVHLSDVPQKESYLDFYAQLTDKLGNVILPDEDYETGKRSNQRWTNIQYDDQKGFTFRHSATRQPLHTDQAYTSFDFDVNFFFCEEQAEIGGATTFVDPQELVGVLSKYEQELFATLQNEEVIFDKGEWEKRVSLILKKEDEKEWLWNWNYFRVSKDNNKQVLDMCNQFHEFLESKIVDGGLLIGIRLKPGECVFFQDKRLLHGRNAFYGNRKLMKGALNFN